jgi:hypothetical protein
MQSRIDMNTLPVGIPWCREENYHAYRAMLEDGGQTPKTWELFAKITEEAEHDWEAKGNFVVRVEIDPRTFPGWCDFHGHRINTQSCHRFAAERALGNAKRRLRGQ